MTTPSKTLSVNATLARAESYAKEGQTAKARQLYNSVLKIFSQNQQAKKGLKALQKSNAPKKNRSGLTQVQVDTVTSLYSHGQIPESLVAIEILTKNYPNEPLLYNISGACYNLLGQFDAAVKSYKHALAINPNYAEVHFNLGVTLQKLGQLDVAVNSYEQALAIKPDYAEAYYNLGITLQKIGQLDAAVYSYSQAIAVNPNYAEAHFNLGNAYQKLGQLDAAINSYSKAVAIRANYAEAYYNLGITLQNLGQLDAAVNSFEQALAVRPDYAEVHFNLGITLQKLGQLDAAVNSFEQALAVKSDYAKAHSNLGVIFKELDQFNLAIQHQQHALKINPEFSEAHYNLGVALKDSGQHHEALRSYERALSIDPEHVDARWNLSLIQLLTENFKEGWANYEWRWLSKDHDPERHYPHSKWKGQPLKDKTLLIYTEQGVGDEVMFCSCIPDLISQAPKLIILECDHRLKPLLERSFPRVDFVIKQALETPNNFKEFHSIDFQVALGTLPRILRSDFKFFSMQQSFLKADPDLVHKWQDRFSELGTGLNIGISWRGGRIESTIKSRSTPLSLWASVLKSDANFINLQYGDYIEEINQVEESIGVSINDWADADPLKDLDNFAAQIAALDLIISIDNSTVHFAGALGTPVWVLLPYAAEWRWFLNRDDSPWYPSVRLFRQKNLDDWESIFEEVINSLKSHDSQIQITADLTALLTVTINAFRMGAISKGHKQLIALLELLASQTTTLSEEKVLKLKMLLNKVLKELEQNNYGAITEILEKEIAVLLNLSLEILPLS